jgi:hypothetical protein
MPAETSQFQLTLPHVLTLKDSPDPIAKFVYPTHLNLFQRKLQAVYPDQRYESQVGSQDSLVKMRYGVNRRLKSGEQVLMAKFRSGSQSALYVEALQAIDEGAALNYEIFEIQPLERIEA